MWLTTLIVITICLQSGASLWEKDSNCPSSCTCRLEHLTETAIYRFMQQNEKEALMPGEITSSEVSTNDVFYETFERDFLEDKSIVRSATCILQTETEPIQLLEALPKDTEIITLIQGYDSGNKSIKFSYFQDFPHLITLEILGPNLLNRKLDTHVVVEIDESLPNLKYVNLERILVKNSNKQVEKFVQELSDEELTFEYVTKYDPNSHPLTILQKGTNEEILPYNKYKKDSDMPLFIGFRSLLFLRITNCELNNVHWEMFDGLKNLIYLILEKNNLKFIPAFAFYGTPNLKTLSLAHNSLLDIQLTDLAGLLELEYLDLSFNNFSQLSELSFPPFPKLKLANFANNPIGVIFPNTFEVMNTTDSLIIGSDDMALTLTTNSFLGLNLLKTLTLYNLHLAVLRKDHLLGMPNLNELSLTGNISSIEFDAFLAVNGLQKLVLSSCSLKHISMDSFIGLEKLRFLDLSKNELEYLPPGVFDQLTSIKELYLNGNKFQKLPRDVFSKIHAKLIRLNDNPWHCSCAMSEWKPMIVNKVKQKIIKPCSFSHDKGIACANENRLQYKYAYDNKVAPTCKEPKQFVNWSVFHAMRRLLKCPDFKPKLKKIYKKVKSVSGENQEVKTNSAQIASSENASKVVHIYKKKVALQRKLRMHYHKNISNELSAMI